MIRPHRRHCRLRGGRARQGRQKAPSVIRRLPRKIETQSPIGKLQPNPKTTKGSLFPSQDFDVGPWDGLDRRIAPRPIRETGDFTNEKGFLPPGKVIRLVPDFRKSNPIEESTRCRVRVGGDLEWKGGVEPFVEEFSNGFIQRYGIFEKKAHTPTPLVVEDTTANVVGSESGSRGAEAENFGNESGTRPKPS